MTKKTQLFVDEDTSSEENPICSKSRYQLETWLEAQKDELMVILSYFNIKHLKERRNYVKTELLIDWKKTKVLVEKRNFRIDSKKWKTITLPNKIEVKHNDADDVWEYLDWKDRWEQIFTELASIREAKKYWKTIVSIEDYKYLISQIKWRADCQKTKLFKKKFHMSTCCYRFQDGNIIMDHELWNHWAQKDHFKERGNIIQVDDTSIETGEENCNLWLPVRCYILYDDFIKDPKKYLSRIY